MVDSGKYNPKHKCGNAKGKLTFDDSEFLYEMKDIKISEVHIYTTNNKKFNNQFLCGYQIFYNYNGQLVTPGIRGPLVLTDNGEYTSQISGNKTDCAKFTLGEDEIINFVDIRSGWIVDGLDLVTSKGNYINGGGKGGSNHSFEGKKFIGFYGNYDEDHNEWDTIYQLGCIFEK